MAKLKFDHAELSALMTKLGDKARLFFVHDQGLYIMSQDEPRPSTVPAETKYWKHTVVYAKGFEPNDEKNPGWWEKSRAAVGGDDFAESIGTAAEYRQILAEAEGDIILNVTASSISTSYLPKRTAAPAEKVLPKPLDIFKGAKSGKWRVVHSVGADEKPILYLSLFAKKSDAGAFVKSLKASPSFKTMHDDLTMRHHAQKVA